MQYQEKEVHKSSKRAISGYALLSFSSHPLTPSLTPTPHSYAFTQVRKNGTVPSGKVAITGAGDLPCTSVIHAVGPVWTGGKRYLLFSLPSLPSLLSFPSSPSPPSHLFLIRVRGEDKELYGAVWQSLLKAHQLNLASISIPAISRYHSSFPVRSFHVTNV